MIRWRTAKETCVGIQPWFVTVYDGKGSPTKHEFDSPEKMLTFLMSRTTTECNTSFTAPGGAEFSVMRKPGERK